MEDGNTDSEISIEKTNKKHKKKPHNITPTYYEIDISDIPSSIYNVNKFMSLQPKLFKTNISKKMIYLSDNQVYNIYKTPVAFNDTIHRVRGYVNTAYDTSTKVFTMILKIRYSSTHKLCYITELTRYVSEQAKHGDTVELYYNKILSDTIIKHCYYDQPAEQWTRDVATLQNEFFLNNKDYLLSIMNNKLDNSTIGSSSNSWNNLILHGVPGVGKCHSIDTPILMYNGGIRKVQDIKVGDLIMGDDSTPRTVLSLARGNEEMYEISQGNDAYTVNKEHVLSLVCSGNKKVVHRGERSSYQVCWFDGDSLKNMTKSFSYSHIKRHNPDNYNDIIANKKALEFFNSIKENLYVDISVKKYLLLPSGIRKRLKGYKVGVEFKEKKVELDPYILGLWLGDSTSSKPEITNQDATILKYLVTNVGKYDCFLQKGVAEYNYEINGIKDGQSQNGFLNLLRYYNVLDNKHIPSFFTINSRDVRLKVLAGLIDSDGYYNNGGYEIVQKNTTLAEDIVFMCKSLGFKTEVSISKKRCWHKDEYKEGIYNRITIYGEGLEQIPILCPRKKNGVRKQIKNALRCKITIRSKGAGDYYGFTLDKNHKYIMGNFIVTHNSSFIYRVSMTLKMSILSVDLSLYLNKKRELYALFHGQEFNLPSAEHKDPKEHAMANTIIVLEEFDHSIEKLLDIENIFKYKDLLKRNYLDMKNKEIKQKALSFVTEIDDSEYVKQEIVASIDKDGEENYEGFMQSMMLEDGIDTKNNTVMDKARNDIFEKRGHDNELHGINSELDAIIKGMDSDNRSNILRLSDLLELFQGPVPIAGRLVIATTNRFAQIQKEMPALFRSGRMSAIEFTYLDWISLNSLTTYYFKESMTLEPFKITVATSQIIELAIKYTLSKYKFVDFEKELYSICK